MPGVSAGLPIGHTREQAVANAVGGVVSGEKIAVQGIGSTDIDVIGKAGEYIAVGGPAKASDLAKFGQKLNILKRAASAAGVEAKAYLEASTPSEVIDVAIKEVGRDNVVLFRVAN